MKSTAFIAGASFVAVSGLGLGPIVQGQFQPFYKTAVLPGVVALNALACGVLLLRRRPLTPLILWLALATFASTLDALLVNLSSGRFSYPWDAGKLITVFTVSVVLVMLLCDIIGPITRRSSELARLGFEVTEAVNGRAAVEAVRRERFDLVFMDLHMPEMDGYEARPRN